jgi:potassium-transporting ATPase KdpC subunit
VLKQLRPAMISVLVFTGLCGLLFPFVVTGIANVIFPHQSKGSLIFKNGHVIGSELIGQNFAKPEYFHPRPSAAGNGYDAANSGGSNLGPTSQKLVDQIRDRVTAYRAENGLAESALVPADAVTTSASGLDPQISPENARLQAARVAQARHTDVSTINRLIVAHTQGRQFGVLGDPGVNVLELNLALDRMIP